MRFYRASLLLALLLTSIIPLTAQSDCTDLPTADAYATRADTAYTQRLYDDTVLDYTCAIQLAPDIPEYYNGRGNAYYWLQQDREANTDFSKVLELDPEAGYAYNNLANLYANIGDYSQALSYYDQAVDYGYGTDIVYTNRASIYIEIGDYSAAQADLDSARDFNPEYPDLSLYQGYLNSILNQVTPAAEQYGRWLQLTQWSITQPQYIANRSYVTRLTTGDVQWVDIALNAGDSISISAAATDNDQHVDPLMVLFDPTGTAVIADDDSGVNIDAVIADYVAEQTGTYVLWLGNGGGYYNQGVDGKVRLSIARKGSDGVVTLEATSVGSVAAATPVPSDEVDVSFSTFRLFSGVTAEIYTTEGDRLNLRGGPGLRFDILGKLDKGARVTLIEGPRKQDGLAWWRIRTADGVEGWAVERVDTEQTLQMALVVGEDAVVFSEGDSLNVRTGAGRSNAVAFQIGDGQHLTLLDVAPTLVDGFQWWKIRLPDGREGWTIDRLEGERTLVPAKELDGGEG